MSEEQMENGSMNDSSSTSQETPNQTGKSDDSKLCAILSYLILGIIWYFLDENLKKNEFAKFHVKQALLLIIVSVIGSAILGLIPILGFLFGLATLVLAVVGIVNSVNGDKKQLPLIGPYAERYLKF